MNIEKNKPQFSELGKKSEYDTQYNPDKLFAIPRQTNRDLLDIQPHTLPFYGFDYWNHYEVSWLNKKGKPCVALAEIIIPCESPNIIESKSMKLYFNSFNNTPFENIQALEKCIEKDLLERLGSDKITVRILNLNQLKDTVLLAHLPGIYLDDLDIDCSQYHIAPGLLKVEKEWVQETLCSDLLKSNCLVTHQPDWGSLQIAYEGYKINHENLLRYIVSFRNDNEFHEHCIEKIFIHLMQYCSPEKLTVSGRFSRRGGIDINPIRSTEPLQAQWIDNNRLYRQ